MAEAEVGPTVGADGRLELPSCRLPGGGAARKAGGAEEEEEEEEEADEPCAMTSEML